MSQRSSGNEGRLFTPAEADQLVPHLETAFRTIRLHRERLQAHIEALDALGIDINEEVPWEELSRPEVTELVRSARTEHEQIRSELEALDALGVEVKGLDGLCDVRSRHQGRIVYLCWQHGEPGFHHWHELDGGFAGRQPVLRDSDFEGTLLH